MVEIVEVVEVLDVVDVVDVVEDCRKFQKVVEGCRRL